MVPLHTIIMENSDNEVKELVYRHCCLLEGCMVGGNQRNAILRELLLRVYHSLSLFFFLILTKVKT